MNNSYSIFSPLIRISVILFYLVGITACSGAVQERVIYQDVYIPVKCEIASPERPVFAGQAAVMVADLITYARELESVIKICAGADNEKSGI